MSPELVLLLRTFALSALLIGLEILTTPCPTKKPLPRTRYRNYERSLKRSYGDKRAPNR